jgi:uncharacterized protein YdeI (BOF family)
MNLLERVKNIFHCRPAPEDPRVSQAAHSLNNAAVILQGTAQSLKKDRREFEDALNELTEDMQRGH